VLNFLALGKQPGIGMIEGGADPVIWPNTNDYAAIHAAGYQEMGRPAIPRLAQGIRPIVKKLEALAGPEPRLWPFMGSTCG
jgi:hypothetical protein